MSQGGPTPSSFYLERQIATRLPATPAAPSGLDSNHAFGHNDPGQGVPTPGDGIIVAGLSSLVVSVWPWPGFTLTGGSLLSLVWFPWSGWTRCPENDITIIAGAYTGPVGYCAAPVRIPSRLGVIQNWLTSSLTGTSPDFLVRIDGFVSVLGMGNS